MRSSKRSYARKTQSSVRCHTNFDFHTKRMPNGECVFAGKQNTFSLCERISILFVWHFHITIPFPKTQSFLPSPGMLKWMKWHDTLRGSSKLLPYDKNIPIDMGKTRWTFQDAYRRGYLAMTTAPPACISLRSAHDPIIRGENDYREIWNYIESNPVKWSEDCFYQTL